MSPHPTSIRLQSSVPVLLVDDVNATAAWYREHLGFDTTGIFPPGGAAAWASLQRDGAEIMLQRLKGYRQETLYERREGGVWNAYIRLTGVVKLYETVKGKPFVKKTLAREPYGDWDFEIVDLNGYVLVFGGDETVESQPSSNAR
jgi:catechol 2,3-dioxygenase-like lactoylglutathione lyase family enzyme